MPTILVFFIGLVKYAVLYGNLIYFYFLDTLDSFCFLSVIPLLTYTNADTQKLAILKDNKGKCGIYRWTNLVSGNSYIGSAVDQSGRFSQYYSYKLMETYLEDRKSVIYSALLKHGYSNFKLEILEYCDPTNVIEREQHYIDGQQPEYNILKTAGSRLGSIHTGETKIIMSNNRIGGKNPMFGKTHSEETKEKFRAAWKSRIVSDTTRAKMSVSKGLGTVLVIDQETNVTQEYASVSQAAKALGTSHVTLGKYIKSQKLFKLRYKVLIKS
jgi:group I intron endonuclease